MGMFGSSKPQASLSAGLLARKGQARPAMRPQGFGDYVQPSRAIDDLGWNDMGDDTPPVPPVLQERQVLAEKVAAPVSESIATPAEPAATIVPEVIAAIVHASPRRGKAAFTLRLDGDRHLRLRLASAVRHLSAQALVTQALDAFLADIPEVEALAARLSQPASDDEDMS